MRAFIPVTYPVMLTLALCLPGGDSVGQDMLISNPATDSIKRYDWRTGTYLGDFVSTGAGGLEYPTAIGFGPDGNLYVGSGPNSQILRFNGATGEFIDEFVDSAQFQGGPSDLRFVGDRLYVSQWNNSRPFNGGVLVYDAFTGDFIEELVDDISRSNAFGFDDRGDLFVSEFSTSSVHVYDPMKGVRQRSISGSPDISGAMDIEFDANGNLLVGSWFDGSVKRIEPDTGTLMDTIVTGLSNTGSLGIAPDGSLLVDDHNNSRIARYDIDTGEFLGFAAQGGGLGLQEKFTFFAVPSPSGICILGFGAAVWMRRTRRKH